MNRKSNLQTVVLVVLVVAGAGAYFARQQGGLDFVMELVGRVMSEPEPAPAPAPKPKPKPPAAKATPAASAPKPEIPPQPAQGEILKTVFTVEAAEIENGVLTLRRAEGPLEVRIFLPGNPWEAPAGRSFRILAPKERSSDTPLVRVLLREPGEETRRGRDFPDGYTLWLEFGRERGRKLPGKIHLALPDEDSSRLVGTFTADIRGFRFVDGKPDLAADSIGTLEYLALREILADDPDKPLQEVAFRGARLIPASGVEPPRGELEVAYRVGEAPPMRQKFRFTKGAGGWRLLDAQPPVQAARHGAGKTP